MTVITVTSVGYAEVRPLSEAGRNFTMILLAGGVTGIGSLPGRGLLVAVGYATFGEIVGRQLHLHTISLEHPNVVLPHLTGEIRQDLMAVL